MNTGLTRREFLELTGLVTVSTCLDSRLVYAGKDWIDAINQILGVSYRPGLAACRIEGTQVTLSAGFGWADLENTIPMTSESLLNIASVSKTITATAAMQLWENGKLELDTDVGKYLPFPVRNPHFPGSVITCRQLLSHRSSLKDGPAYDRSYSCGDPVVSLSDWLEDYLCTHGSLYSALDNFHDWSPGTEDPPPQPRSYSNVGYGLLALIVENTVKQPFSSFTAEHIFSPLGMDSTAWHITEIDSERHAVPYTAIGEEFEFPAEYPDP